MVDSRLWYGPRCCKEIRGTYEVMKLGSTAKESIAWGTNRLIQEAKDQISGGQRRKFGHQLVTLRLVGLTCAQCQ